VGDIANALHLTEKTLARRILMATGSSPSKLIQKVRMRKAQMLLETNKLSIERVAEAVDYRDATALRKLALKHTHLPPSRLRSNS
jgi:transcriptional regulator GlxA family with amidase domain